MTRVAAEATRRDVLLARLAAGVGVGSLLCAAPVIALAMGDLRGAYLYRESTGEGIALAQVAMRPLAGGFLAVIGVATLTSAAGATTGRVRMALRGAALAASAALSGCAAVALWVSFQGGCIGSCG